MNRLREVKRINIAGGETTGAKTCLFCIYTRLYAYLLETTIDTGLLGLPVGHYTVSLGPVGMSKLDKERTTSTTGIRDIARVLEQSTLLGS